MHNIIKACTRLHREFRLHYDSKRNFIMFLSVALDISAFSLQAVHKTSILWLSQNFLLYKSTIINLIFHVKFYKIPFNKKPRHYYHEFFEKYRISTHIKMFLLTF